MTIAQSIEIIQTADGPMDALVICPRGVGPFVPVILFQHIGGLSPTMKLVARRIAEGGFYAIAPALYHRLGTIVVHPTDPAPAIAAIRSIAANSLTRCTIAVDIEATLDALVHDSRVRQGRCGIVSYGAGAGHAIAIAATQPNSVGAVACVLGNGIVNDGPDSHHALPYLGCETYFAYCGRDKILPASLPDQLRQRLAGNPRARIVVHPDAEHGYCFSDRAEYDAHAAEADWTAIFDMFRRM